MARRAIQDRSCLTSDGIVSAIESTGSNSLWNLIASRFSVGALGPVTHFATGSLLTNQFAAAPGSTRTAPGLGPANAMRSSEPIVFASASAGFTVTAPTLPTAQTLYGNPSKAVSSRIGGTGVASNAISQSDPGSVTCHVWSATFSSRTTGSLLSGAAAGGS